MKLMNMSKTKKNVKNKLLREEINDKKNFIECEPNKKLPLEITGYIYQLDENINYNKYDNVIKGEIELKENSNFWLFFHCDDNYNFNNIIPKKEKRNSQKQLLPIKSNQNSNKNNIKKKQNNNNQNENIKIKLDQKGVYISQEDDIFEDQNDPVNKLNTALKYKQSNNLRISQEEKNMIDTIKKVSSNRVQYRNTHQMLKEIGKIMKNPVVSFLIHKEPVEKNEVDNPSDKLSQMLSEKMLEEKKKRKKKFDFLSIDELFDLSNYEGEKEAIIDDELHSNDEAVFETKIIPKKKKTINPIIVLCFLQNPFLLM